MTSTVNANATQFQGYTGGPQEAQEVSSNAALRRHLLPGVEEQLRPARLFDPKTVAMPEAHTQTPEQFAKDPRTWWHGRYTAEKSRLGGGQGREGFHAGTEGAARQRLATNFGRRASKEGVGGHLFPLRITGPVEGPEDVKEDVNVHRELGPRRYGSWGGGSYGGRTTGYLYRNRVEDVGSISVGVPRRKGFMATHKEMVTQAQQRGEKVHPLIAWAAKKAPEHTGEEYPVRRAWSGGPAAQEHAPMIGGGDKIERTSYVTQGGRIQHVHRYRGIGPGSALLGKQWEPTSRY